jgi:serine/threonine protein kinase
MLLSEVDIYKRLSNPNIVNLIEIFNEQNTKIHLVMEICRGGELYERLAARSCYDERAAALLTKQMLAAVAYLHSLRVVHRDLKLEHWLFSTHDQGERDQEQLKLCDFGFGSLVHPGTHLTATLGSVHYVAPEVLGGKYGLECDEWSLGVIVYMLLSGSPPFEGESDEEIMSKIRLGKYSMNGARWERITEEGKDFVSRLLVVDPEKRMTAEEGLRHKWLHTDFFSTEIKGHREISRSVVDLLQSHASQVCVLRAAVGLIKLLSTLERFLLTKSLEIKLANSQSHLSVTHFVDMLRQIRPTDSSDDFQHALTKFLTISHSTSNIPLKDLLLFIRSLPSPHRFPARVHSVPSKPIDIFFPSGWYRAFLRPFYARQPVSNLVLGLVHGSSSFARRARDLRLTLVHRLLSGSALFLLPNPKFHDDLTFLAAQTHHSPAPPARFVVWWVAREFVPDLLLWHDTHHSQAEPQAATVGDPGDFGFSGERKPAKFYLHTYRDLQGESGLEVLRGFQTISREFLQLKYGAENLEDIPISRGFHFPVRTQYSTLHMQIRVNSGNVVGADGRGILLENVAEQLQQDAEVFAADREALRFRVTENIKANLLAAAAVTPTSDHHCSSAEEEEEESRNTSEGE